MLFNCADLDEDDIRRRDHWIETVEEQLGHLLREPEGRPHPEAQEVLRFAAWRLQAIRDALATKEA
jgi:hypothetical protein